jgi:hypothetical protein
LAGFAALHSLYLVQQGLPIRDDPTVARTQVLARPVHDRAHTFLSGEILSIQAGDSGEAHRSLHLPVNFWVIVALLFSSMASACT